MTGRPTLYDVDRAGLAALLAGEPAYRVEQVWEGLYGQGREPAELTTVPKALRARLDEELPTALTEITRSVTDDGATTKFLWSLDDGPHIETVLMHYDDRTTVCVSTQAGCAMACSFCATGQAGFERQLSVGEIVEQVVRARRAGRDSTTGDSTTGDSTTGA
ncbi:MAG: 23S rRNA (adenine(2503)-C(2))-methyltransferase RlmN, partial [Actinobacteria bacterium]|nr:23S rRNA (adenine(2503)-C(2))-methyltransferase RlmN [Actinomycetota bacterium]